MNKDGKIIDAHNHLWKLEGEHFDWINEEMQVIRRDFDVEDLKLTLKENDVDGSILVQAVPTIAETEWLLDIANKEEIVKGVIGWCDIASGASVKDDLKSFMDQSSKIKGIRYMSQGLPAEHLTDEKFIEGCRAVGEMGLVYELLITPEQLDQAAKLIEACPDVTFVIEHIAKPNIKNKEIDKWQEGMKKLASISDKVNCKISGMVTEADTENWTNEDFYPYLDSIYESFGEDRMLYGSDWPVALLGGTYTDILNIVKNWLACNDQINRDKIFYENSKRVYKI